VATFLTAMRLRIDNPNETLALLAYLHSWSDVVAERVGIDEVEVGLLGSWARPAMEDELMMRVRAWADAQRARGADVGVGVEVVAL
jgi:hypothetical protein